MHNVENLILPLILFNILIIVVLIVYGIYIKNIIEKNNASINTDYKNYKEELKNQNDILTEQLLQQISKQSINSGGTTENTPPSKNLMSIFIKLRESIKENCINTMNQIGAARIAIYLFHNGTHSTHGISFLKMSCICEKVAIGNGVRERMIEHTNIPINLFDDMIEKLVYNNRYIVMNNKDLQETNHKMFISADKISYAQLIAIYDINNNLIGFVSTEMSKSFSKEEADKDKEVIDELVKQLVPVLSYSDYTSFKAN